MARVLGRIGLLMATLLLLLTAMRLVGQVLRAPQVTYSGFPDGLYVHDLWFNRSVSLVTATDTLPVAWSWSPDGRQLAYVLLEQPRSLYQIRVLDTTDGQTHVAAQGLPYGGPPQWSPDGSRIAAISPEQDICLYDASGQADEHCLSVMPAAQPSWSPDGTALAFLRLEPGGGLWRVDLDDGLTIALAAGLDRVNSPRWSPDGRWVVYSWTPQVSEPRHFYLVRANGSTAPRQLTDGRTSQDQPQWSPDSRYIAYNEYPLVNRTPRARVVEVETGEVLPPMLSQFVNTDPRWSPDGQLLAYVSVRTDQRPQLYIQHFGEPVNPMTDPPGLMMRLYAYAWRP
jgi:Tol biopolymer transport system component